MTARLMASIRVDAGAWPILVVTLPSAVTDDELRSYLEQLGAHRGRGQDYAIIVDANLSRGFSAKQRQMQADYIAAGLELTKRHLKAFAFVARSPMQRGMLTAVFWLGPPAWPHRVFSTLDEAKHWCSTMLAQANS